MNTISDPRSTLINFLTMAPVFLIAITIHELSHGLAAYYFGDTTAKDQGRLTLNPIKHLDPLGTIMFIVTAWAMNGAGIGWAKPVPVNPYRFRNLRLDMVLVSLAGPFSNFILAFILAKLFILNIDTNGFFGQMLMLAVYLNILLGIFNLLPIPPLDGSKIIPSLLPTNAQQSWFKFERYGMLILLVLFMSGSGVIGTIISGPAQFMLRLALFPVVLQ